MLFQSIGAADHVIAISKFKFMLGEATLQPELNATCACTGLHKSQRYSWLTNLFCRYQGNEEHEHCLFGAANYFHGLNSLKLMRY
jgi:hypothetical protein